MRTYAAADWMWHVAYTFTWTLMQNIHHSLSLIAFPKSSLCCFSPCMLFLHVSWSLNVYILPGGMNEAFYWPTRAFDFETENGCLPCACVLFVYLRVRALSKSTSGLCARSRACTCPPRALSTCLIAAQNFTWHQSACKEIVISLQASCSWLKPAVATSLFLSVSFSLSLLPSLFRFLPLLFSIQALAQINTRLSGNVIRLFICTPDN